MIIKELLKQLEGCDPESRIVIDDENECCREIEYIGFEKDLDRGDGEPLIIAVIYQKTDLKLKK